jgi:excisionase family DNA binding protein
MTNLLLTKREVARRLGLSEASVERVILRGELPVVKVSQRAVRIPGSAVEAFIEERTHRGMSRTTPHPSPAISCGPDPKENHLDSRRRGARATEARAPR